MVETEGGKAIRDAIYNKTSFSLVMLSLVQNLVDIKIEEEIDDMVYSKSNLTSREQNSFEKGRKSAEVGEDGVPQRQGAAQDHHLRLLRTPRNEAEVGRREEE